MSENIVRAFSFFNDRSSNANRIDADVGVEIQAFHTLGYFDKFVTRKIDMNEEELPNMLSLWETINSMNKRLVDTKQQSINDESFQNIFGVALQNKDEGIEIRDETFWGNTDYAYTFVILVQFYNNSTLKLKEKINLYKKSFIEAVKERLNKYKSYFIDGVYDEELKDIDFLNNNSLESQFMITDYVTYDRYDYILTVKCNFYLPIVSAMQQLYALKNGEHSLAVKSFTVPALSNNQNNLINEIVPSVSIECSYNESNMYLYNKNTGERFEVEKYLNWFCEEFIKPGLYDNNAIAKHKLYYISGEHDLRIHAHNIRMSKLTAMIPKMTSPYLYGFSTTINVPHKKLGYINYDGFVSDKYTLVKDIVDCGNIISSLESKGFPKELIKTLHQINSGLSAIRPVISQYRGYGFYSLFTEFKFYLKMLLEVDKNDSNSIVKAFEVAKAFGSALLTTIRSDFRCFQIPTFNANLYYAPTKLLVFYRAFISSLLKYYSKFNNRSDEHFIICIENKINIDVEQKLKVDGDNKVRRFFVCRMSEKNLYSIKDTMIQLNHEIAHYGLGVIRNRRQRVKYLVDSFIKAYLLLLRVCLYKMCATEKVGERYKKYLDYIKSKEFADKFFAIFKEYLHVDFFNDQCNNYYFKETLYLIGNRFEKKKDYFEKTICADILYNINSIGENIGETYKVYTDFCSLLRDAMGFVEKQVFVGLSRKKISKVGFFLEYCYKECFADMITILTLNLKPMDYIKTLINANKDNRVDNAVYLLKYRFFAVCESIGKCSLHSLKKRWSAEELGKLYSIEDKTIKNIIEPCLAFETDVLASFSNFDSKEARKYLYEALRKENNNISILNILPYDFDLFINLKNYIGSCIELYIEKQKDEGKELSPMIIYRNMQKHKVSEQIFYMDYVLEQFEKYCSDDSS